MASLSPQVILIVYWLIVLVLAAFSLRMACSLCRTDMPYWRRAFTSVLVVTFLTYLVFDFSCYLIMRGMDGAILRVPPGYGYSFWFREWIVLKWHIVSRAGVVKYLPFVFALCAAGTLQLIVLQAQVTFRYGLLIFVMQWGATLVGGYIVSLLFGLILNAVGWTPPVPASPPQGKYPPMAQKGGPPKYPPKAAKGQTPTEGPAVPSTLVMLQDNVGEAVQDAKGQLTKMGAVLRTYTDTYLEELKEIAAPVTKHLPAPVQSFLEQGGWWLVLGVCAFLALLWLRSFTKKLRKALRRPGKKKKKRAVSPPKLRVNLQFVGDAFTDPGPRQAMVKGMPARLRLVVLSMGAKGGGDLNEDMADRILDWIHNGLAEVASHDHPRVRVWPALYSADGFSHCLQLNVPLPEPKGMKSHWVVVAGAVHMGPLVINVGLALYTENESSLRFLRIMEEKWRDALTVEQSLATVGT